MGLLDDLKSEAEKLQNQQSAEEEQRQQKEALYQQEINPTLQKISAYVSEMADQLNVVKPDTNPTYTIPGHGDIKGLIQQDYSVNADSLEQMKQLRLRFKAVLPNDIEFSVTPKPKADETRSFLEEQNFTFSEWPVRDNHQRLIGINFQVKVNIEILFLFRADIENGRIQLTIVNFENFTVKNKSYTPQAITDAWLDDLGHYILRKIEILDSLTMTDDQKAQLREQLRREKAKRSKELQKIIEREEAEEKEKNKQSFVNIIKKKLTGKGET